LTVSEKEISVMCYSYGADKVQYDKLAQKNEGLQNSVVELLKDGSFDLKLCQYCIVDSYVAKYQIQELFSALNNAKFSPDINVVAADNFEAIEEYLDGNEVKNPIYNWQLNSKGISAKMPIIGKENAEIVMLNSCFYTTIKENQAYFIRTITNMPSKGSYNFNYGDKIFSAVLEDANTYYSVKNNVLTVKLMAKLATYRGMTSGKNNREEFIQLAQQTIKREIEAIYEDDGLVEQYNLFWYKKVKEFDTEKGIDVDVTIV
ncbi:MAG: hypothetical protein RR728_04545, partial [Oscillospiraceae bacterium]